MAILSLFLLQCFSLIYAATSLHCQGSCMESASHTIMSKYMPHKLSFYNNLQQSLAEKGPKPDLGFTKCNGTAAGEFPCEKVDLVGFASHTSLGSSAFHNNDIWGWTDPETNREYALVGQWEQTAIVDVTDGVIRTVANLAHTPSVWSDIKVYNNHMYVGGEGGRRPFVPSEGIQVFDLTRLREMVDSSKIHQVEADYTYVEGMNHSHNVVINEDSGFLYVVGSNTCKGGLHIADLKKNPKKPEFTACFASDGYTHDAQCVIYKGADKRYYNREICFNYNEDTLTIVDVHDKENIKQLSRTTYKGQKYTHQGWLTDDHQYILLNDELDELKGNVSKHAHTYIWNVKDLEYPFHSGNYFSPVESIDHNLYIKGNRAYLSNYNSGLRVVDISDISNGNLKEIGHFDVHPEANSVRFTGVWSSYVYFKSGNIIVNSSDRGLFVVKENMHNNC